ncbi:hypothetical protein [Bradyrhizobium sp. WSM471]|uniref:hypothetical protein n=1 Tax=Bradyrhizobium sp. WSM471 TaxID=319017 RepID=UPI00024D21C8|nr:MULTISPECIES: hypothetical protein [Bradyrhizobium]EHR01343.1 hypothetical protein Bra471DRAFT_02052 [Bradyrhizobium sp. WSM471]UFW43403.1 hypothetical protein BcanWSM471_10090 [Bradyrhizobium canariense]
MEDSQAPARVRQSALPWVIVALVVFAGVASVIWMNNRIEALEAANAPHQVLNGDETQHTLAALQQSLNDIKNGQTTLADQVSQLQRRIAAEQGERKLLSDQLGSISGRVDALSSSNAEANTSPQQPQRNRRSKH